MRSEITVQNVVEILAEYCDYDGEILPCTELLDSGILDSLVFIELLNALEDMGCPVQPTQHPRERFSTPESIAELANRCSG